MAGARDACFAPIAGMRPARTIWFLKPFLANRLDQKELFRSKLPLRFYCISSAERL
jgi:hypothetical protein